MIAQVLVGEVALTYYTAGSSRPSVAGASYPFLVDIPPITESTSAESGSASIVLTLDAYRILGLPIGKIAKILDGAKVVFEGVIADVTLDGTITLQLEA